MIPGSGGGKRRVRFGLRVAVLGAMLAAGAACAARTGGVRGAARPLRVAPPAPEAAARLLEAAAAAAASVRRYQAVLGVRGAGAGGRFSGRLLVVFERPPGGPDAASGSGGIVALRISAFAPVGGVRWSLVARPGVVVAVVPSERAFASGSELRDFTEAFLGVRGGLEEVAAMVSGSGVPIAPRVIPEPAPGGGFSLPGGAVLWWDSEDPAPQSIRAAAGDGYEVRYPEPFLAKGQQVPRRIRIFADGVEAELAVEELELNTELHPEAFEVRIPEGFRRSFPSALAAALRPSG